jgi:hypothetical protein
MPDLPMRASGPREPAKPRPVPTKIREACLMMIFGRPDDENAVPIDFVAAAKLVGLRPVIMRKWLHKPAVVALIRRERAAFRQAICAANEYALRKVRDTSENGMAIIGSVRALQELDETASPRHAEQENRHLTIRIVGNAPPAGPTPVIIDHEPQPKSIPEPGSDPNDPTRSLAVPRFRWPKDE